jgi:DNA primase
MPTNFVDFKELKRQVPIRDVLERYKFLERLQDKGQGKLVGPCPLHAGKNPNSFHVNTDKNVYNCFSSCGGGNILDLVMKVEQCSIREAGLKLADWFDVRSERTEPRKGSAAQRRNDQASPAPARQETPPRLPP